MNIGEVADRNAFEQRADQKKYVFANPILRPEPPACEHARTDHGVLKSSVQAARQLARHSIWIVDDVKIPDVPRSQPAKRPRSARRLERRRAHDRASLVARSTRGIEPIDIRSRRKSV